MLCEVAASRSAAATASTAFAGADRLLDVLSAAGFLDMARVSIRPTWVGVLDFETRFPSALCG
ncbi:MAG TPA: hypothetical protein VIU62_14195 [Chloroflexota bacterium]|jgi:hypothetical protein